VTTAVGSLNTALGLMGYVSVPGGAFDASGNITLPEGFAVPQGWGETVGRVTRSPDFQSLLHILGTLTAPGTDWTCYRVALSFQTGQLRVILVRDTQAVGDNQTLGANWSNNLWSTVVPELKNYAGSARIIPPVNVDALNAVVDKTKEAPYWESPCRRPASRHRAT